ncbi:MAG: anti-sigma factor family protein [Anaerolineales bacterium]
MHEEMRAQLNAYLDGELQGRRLRDMETHLVSCAECRKELGELRRVSERLQTDIRVEALSAERFISQLTLSLPRRPQLDRQPKSMSPAWWLIPAGLLMGWVFIQTVYTLTDLVTAANFTGVLGSASGWLGSGQESVWLGAATTLFGGQLLAQPALGLLNSVSVSVSNFFIGYVWQAGIVLLYWTWLGTWWLRRNRRSKNMVTAD